MFTDSQKTLITLGVIVIAGYVLISALVPLFATSFWKEQGWFYIAWIAIISYHLFNHRKEKHL